MDNNIFEIKPEFLTAIVGFNNSCKPLGERKDLDKLAMLAHVNPNLKKLFVNLPTKEQIKEYQGGKFLINNPAPEVVEVPVVVPVAPEEEILQATPEHTEDQASYEVTETTEEVK